jgi:hypothetical protein
VTLLSVVDPLANELRPILLPRAVAAGVCLWSVGAMLAVAAGWVERSNLWPRSPGGEPILGYFIVACLAMSGLGALAFVRPHAGRAVARGMPGAILGVAAYVPLVWLMWRWHVEGTGAVPRPFGLEPPADAGSLWDRLLQQGVGVLIVLGLRPNARLLWVRSLLMRQGRVDRQTLLAVAATMGVCMLGYGLRLLSLQVRGGAEELLDQTGQLVVLVGSVLLTVGLIGVVVDTIRLYPVLIEPPLGLHAVLGPEEQTPP